MNVARSSGSARIDRGPVDSECLLKSVRPGRNAQGRLQDGEIQIGCTPLQCARLVVARFVGCGQPRPASPALETVPCAGIENAVHGPSCLANPGKLRISPARPGRFDLRYRSARSFFSQSSLCSIQTCHGNSSRCPFAHAITKRIGTAKTLRCPGAFRVQGAQ